jgi:2-C-methyl-D-erythritol 2,4-cyclodiphosphate synthase
VNVFRVGIGWDRHRLAPGRPCKLGGVQFTECPLGLVGHSDGDAVCHALIDAMLGAAALGDIGRHFPDTEPRWEGAEGLDLLARAVALLRNAGFRVVNADCTVIAELPVIAPRAAAMSEALSAPLNLAPAEVSVKATRGEGLGPEGRAECVTVLAVALVEKAVCG